MLVLSFEPNGDGYTYYHNRWSRGVPVTAEEREAYLDIPALGSRRAWRAAISGRRTLPPRPYGPTARKIRGALPLRMALSGIVFGIAALLGGLGDLWSDHMTPGTILWSVLLVFAGAAMLAFGASVAIAHLSRSGADAG